MGFNHCGFVIAVLVAAAAVGKGDAATFVVGDTLGWRVPNTPADYSNWASRNPNITVGDVLVFNFMTGNHDVAQVTKAGFDACSSTNPIISLSTVGPWSITVNSSGEHYFICTFGTHCSLGQKLAINVTAPSSPPSPTPVPAPSSPTTPTPVPAPTPPTMTPTPSVSPTPTPTPTPMSAPAPAPAPGTPMSPTPSSGPSMGPGPSMGGPGSAPSSMTTPGGTGSAPSSETTPGDSGPPSPPSSATLSTMSATLAVFAVVAFGLAV